MERVIQTPGAVGWREKSGSSPVFPGTALCIESGELAPQAEQRQRENLGPKWEEVD